MTSKKLDKKYTYLWALWLIAFGVIEYFAIKGGAGRSLTANVRKMLETHETAETRSSVGWLWRFGVGVLFAWLIPHFFTGVI